MQLVKLAVSTVVAEELVQIGGLTPPQPVIMRSAHRDRALTITARRCWHYPFGNYPLTPPMARPATMYRRNA